MVATQGWRTMQASSRKVASRWRGRRFHAGIEGRIRVLKRKHGLDRCRNHGEEGCARWVGWGVIANNLADGFRTKN